MLTAERDTLLHAELDRWSSRFQFEEGAVLVQIPQVPLALLEPEVARNRGYFAYPPQGLLYLSAVLGALGIERRIVDLNFEVLREAQRPEPNIEATWRRALDEALAAFRSPFVCVSFMFDPTYPEFKKVCEYVRRTKPDACIAAGGINATADSERLLSEQLVDLVCSHEGEETLRRFYGYLRGHRGSLPVNLAFVGSEGAILRTPKFLGGEVDVDVRQEYARIPIKEYHTVGSLSNFSRMTGVDVPYATLIAKRGCRAQCTFCGVRNFNGQGLRVRDVDGVIEEMQFLYDRYGIRHFDWLDDDLIFDREKSLALFTKIGQRFPGITWAANNGIIAAAITPEIMVAMEKSRCMGFKVGLESGNESVLRSVKKPTNLSKFYAFARLAQEYPTMFVSVNFILGFPDERFGQMLDSFKAAIRARLDWNNFYIYQHIKNTELFIAYGGLSEETPETDHGKEGQGPNLNPVRGGAFRNYRVAADVVSGYDVIGIDPASVPSKAQLKEIWFTFNYVSNFLRLPALSTDSEIRVRNAVRWMKVLSQAYPEDAAMTCVAYYLNRRLMGPASEAAEARRRAATAKFERSEYWRFRDKEFRFSALLDGEIPPVDSRYDEFFAGGS